MFKIKESSGAKGQGVVLLSDDRRNRELAGISFIHSPILA